MPHIVKTKAHVQVIKTEQRPKKKKYSRDHVFNDPVRHGFIGVI